ncbi:MAG: TrkH family potassium uptake protein [Lachnospiraceae bacterium]|nr:TrkH family potassium uptake protein [Lachnospiraceae bacterium]
MNRKMVVYILGGVLSIEALLMLLPIITGLIYREKSVIWFFITAAACALTGILLSRKKPADQKLYTREGFVSVALSWVVLSIFGAMPFYLSGEIPHFTDAFFETVSGFTTTGASILPDVEKLSKCMLFWRSFTHWIGGMGVLVFVLAILPMAGAQNIHILRAESPGPSVGKLVPKVGSTAKILYGLYLVLTVLEQILLLAGGMPLFDALCVSFGTAGTGGFAVTNAGLGGYSMYLQGVASVFMVLFGVNFNVYFLLYARKPKDALKSEEARVYLLIILASALMITWNSRHFFSSLFESFHHSLFQVASIMTTTGFSTTDFNQWPSLSKAILVLLMFVGACAGSTGGGIKVSRITILVKTVLKEMASMIHPNSVKIIKMEGKPVEHNVLRSINTYLATYIMIFVASLLIVCLDRFDLTTSFTAIAATFNNIGPGLEMVGPTCHYGEFSDLAKYVMIFDMLAGRLELFPLVLLFSVRTWRKQL